MSKQYKSPMISISKKIYVCPLTITGYFAFNVWWTYRKLKWKLLFIFSNFCMENLPAVWRKLRRQKRKKYSQSFCWLFWNSPTYSIYLFYGCELFFRYVRNVTVRSVVLLQENFWCTFIAFDKELRSSVMNVSSEMRQEMFVSSSFPGSYFRKFLYTTLASSKENWWSVEFISRELRFFYLTFSEHTLLKLARIYLEIFLPALLSIWYTFFGLLSSPVILLFPFRRHTHFPEGHKLHHI